MDTQLTWYGQSAFKIVTPGGKVLLVDPWLSNPVFENAKDEIAALKHVDLILITHGHSDHVGDAVDIGKKTGAKLVATFDLADAIVKHLGYPAEQAQVDTVGHIGGDMALLDGEVKVAFVRAHHVAAVAADDRYAMRYGGSPGGFVISIRGGPTIYHTGDTDLFSDMALVSQKQDRYHARMHRRPFYDGAGTRRRSDEARRSAHGDSDALCDISCADRHAGSVRARTKKTQRESRAARNEDR